MGMHHPGPPRFTSVGDPVELAPRDPNPGRSYTWKITEKPLESTLELGSEPVVHFDPDVPGTYRVRLDTPDENHELTIRAFPDERRDTRFELPVDELPRPPGEIDRISLISPFNERIVGADRPTLEDDAYVLDAKLEPGSHKYGFCLDDDFEDQIRGELQIPGPGRPLVTLDAHLDDTDVVITADAVPAHDSDIDPDEVSVEFYPDDRDTLDVDELTADGHAARFPAAVLESEPGTASIRIHAVAKGERRSVGDAIAISSPSGTDTGSSGTGIDQISVDHLNAPPDWASAPTMYEIFVRSFAGPTLDTSFSEIERRIPYLDSLGIDCVWLTPVLESPTTHGYHITNFFDTADDLGTREEFESLVDACHDAGIKVIFDLVVNHTSRDHPAFQMSAANVPEYRDHYVWEEQADDSKRAQRYFNWRHIPNVNYDSLDVRSWMLDVVDEWADVVDGFRADVAWGVPHGFWKEVRERVREDHPEFLLLDETIPRDARFHELEFDMHYDTTVYGQLRKIGSGEAPADSLLDAVRESDYVGFHPDSVHLRYIENHDEDRYLDECPEAALRPAVAATFTLPGAPMVYYGQERGMTEYRGPMRWHDGDTDLTEFHRRLSFTRQETPALESGDLDTVAYEASSDRVVVFERNERNEAYVVVLNFGADTETVTLPGDVNPSDSLTDDTVSVDVSASGDEVTVAVEDVIVLPRQ